MVAILCAKVEAPKVEVKQNYLIVGYHFLVEPLLTRQVQNQALLDPRGVLYWSAVNLMGLM